MDARVQKMIDLWIWYCSVANLGYDQWNRWDFPEYGDTEYAGECDCSSLMYHCAVEAGFNLPTSGTRYTGTMKRDFINAGFKWLDVSREQDMPVGAIAWKSTHTGGWTGHKICEAYSDERGGSHSGQDGDQANETRMSNPRGGWEGCFYWPETEPPIKWPQEVEPMGDAVDYIVEEGSNEVAHVNKQETYFYRYIKYASGLMKCYISDYFNGGTGSKYEGQWYLNKTLEWPECYGGPAFVDIPIVSDPSVRAANGYVTIQFKDFYKNKATFYAYGTKKVLPKFYVDCVLVGSWK